MRKIITTSFLVCIAYILFFSYVHSRMEEERNLVLAHENKILETSYKAITQMFSIAIENYFHYVVMQPSVLNILHEVHDTNDSTQKATLRDALYNLLSPFYNNDLKRLEIRQFQFHTAKGESFLRFHAPSEYGDDLLAVRPSIRQINDEKIFISGFEGGRTYQGFRYVFPIIDEKIYLGSVEISLSYNQIERELSKLIHWEEHTLLLKKSISSELVFDTHKQHFVASPLSEEYVTENQENDPSHLLKAEVIEKINTILKKRYSVEKKLQEGKNFSIPMVENNVGYIANFHAIYDLSNTLVAYAVTYSHLDELVNIQHKYITSLLFGFLIFLMLGIGVYLLVEQSQKTLHKKIQFETIVEKTINGVILLNAKGEITFLNAAATSILGYSLNEVLMQDAHSLIHVHQQNNNPKEKCPILNAMRYQRTYIGEEIFCKKNGEHFIVHLNATPFVQDNHNIGSIVIFRDITTEKKTKEMIEHLAYYDSLTELPNRKLLLDRLSYTIANSQRTKEYCGLLFIDLDNFKILNDTQGHEYGDMLLKQVARRLSENLRTGDTVSRFGGDEFVVLVTKLGANEKEAKEKLAQIGYKILQSISETFHLSNLAYTCTASIGGTIFRDGDKTVNTILRDADLAMYEVKKESKNEIKII
ncbi:diguanylate cyclase domain-containing protein [Sulfurospirillum oryzae]|uniref:diguanylate cyclase domain-containing protein n=1 Tax=Sulfurospirillum oryzae TaxID=2976535 RepID=UPI0021E6EE57|nr:diguanylate cyclase [Sulfurospirillum oryzae]